ncbi:MAG: GNAT family N-acetyltransferase [Ardenticatenaceae bacterium]|nr:GNAT family N-acetyltransferase [Ardenticatenaceae bacterium]
MFSIRKFNKSQEDYEKLAHIWNIVWPDDATDVDSLRFDDDTLNPKHFFERILVEDRRGDVVGYGRYCETWWADTADQYEIYGMVDPQHRQKGIASQMYDHIMAELAPRQPQSYLTDTREDQQAAIQFIEKKGFVQHMREPQSQIDLEQFDPSQFGDLYKKISARGISLINLPEFQAADENWLTKLYDFTWEVEQDIPYFEEVVRKPLHEFEHLFGRPGFVAEGWYLAVDDATGDLVGASNIWMYPTRPTLSNTGLTGVSRGYRRMGIARALKGKVLTFAKSSGRPYVRTENEENNPMYQLNLQLGFEPIPGWLFYKKREERQQTTDHR